MGLEQRIRRSIPDTIIDRVHKSTLITPVNASFIPRITERSFALFLVSKGLEVYYEPYEFKGKNGKGTAPDFFVRNPKNPNSKGSFIEITAMPRKNGRNKDPKTKQKRVMREGQNGQILYHILYKNHLENINRFNPHAVIFENVEEVG